MGRKGEEYYCVYALATSSTVLGHNCKFTRGNGLSNGCPNDGCCRDRFGSPTVAEGIVHRLRLNLWTGDNRTDTTKPWTITDRRRALKRILLDGRIEYGDARTPVIRHFIAGVQVCKDFFRAATGFERKMFNNIYLEALSGLDDMDQETISIGRKPMGEEREEDVCSFLDTYFKAEDASIEADPAGVTHLFLKKRWSELYAQNYVPACILMETTPAKYNIFCEIRKRCRPMYQRSRKVRASGWNHVRCQTCENCEDNIRRAKDPDEKSRLRFEYKAHKYKAAGHRKHYRDVRHKAIQPSRHRSDMSVILDGAGGLGSTYAPHFAVSGKGEPERHTLHKFKSTFSKIHGVGTCIFLSHSSLETEGSNLNLECLYRSVDLFLQTRKVDKIRNLYVQLDNTNSNKSWALIGGCAALVALGIVRKVKV